MKDVTFYEIVRVDTRGKTTEARYLTDNLDDAISSLRVSYGVRDVKVRENPDGCTVYVDDVLSYFIHKRDWKWIEGVEHL